MTAPRQKVANFLQTSRDHGAPPVSGTRCGPRLLIITNNRFWRGRIGSHARIATVHSHYVRAGWDVMVAFDGCPYGEDETECARQGVHARFSRPTGITEQAEGEPRQAMHRFSVKAALFAHHAWRWGRALLTQAQRLTNSWNWKENLRALALRAKEPRVTDGIDIRLVRMLTAIVSENAPHVILVEYVLLAWIIDFLRPLVRTNTIWLLDTHEVMYERQIRFHAAGQKHALDITAKEEARWLSKFDVVLAIQQRDAEKFQAMKLGSRVLTLHHPVPAIKVPRGSHLDVGLGFLGSNMAPNNLALRELLEHVWPLVHAQLGAHVKLIVAGAVCETFVDAAPPAGVEFLGHLADLDDFYKRVDIIASPIRFGGGLKIKNIEALCKGKALVTTAVGAEGMEGGAGSAYSLVDTAREMAVEIVRLAQDSSARESMAEQGFALAAAAFSENVAFGELDAFLTQKISSFNAQVAD